MRYDADLFCTSHYSFSGIVSCLRGFPCPKSKLEQYQILSGYCWWRRIKDDIHQKTSFGFLVIPRVVQVKKGPVCTVPPFMSPIKAYYDRNYFNLSYDAQYILKGNCENQQIVANVFSWCGVSSC